MSQQVTLGRDGCYTLMFFNYGESPDIIKSEFSKYGEVARVKVINHNTVFLSFYKEADAQRCLEDNPFMKVPENKEKNAKQNGISRSPRRTDIDHYNWRNPQSNSVISHYELRSKVVRSTSTFSTIASEAVERIMTMPWEQHKESIELGKDSSTPKECERIMTKTLEQQKEKVQFRKDLSPPKDYQKITTVPWEQQKGNIELRKEYSTQKGSKDTPFTEPSLLDKSEPSLAVKPEVAKVISDLDPSDRSSPPPLVKRFAGPECAERPVDIVLANFPNDLSRETIFELVYQLMPMSVGDIKWTNTVPRIAYIHILLSPQAAEILCSWNHLMFRGQRLIVAPSQTLIEESYT